MTEKELRNRRDKIIFEMRELNEQLKLVDAQLIPKNIASNGKPQVVYNDYKSW